MADKDTGAGLTVAVTGAAGAVGARVVELALEAGCHVIAVARDAEDLPETKRSYERRIGDLTQRRFCRQAVQGADIVVHAAALNDPTLSYEELAPANVEAVRWLYEAAEDSGARRFIHLSTASLYKPRRGVLHEDAEFETRSSYSLTKEEAERFLRSRTGGDALPWTILRPALAYGPRGRSLGSTVLLLPPLLRLFTRYVPAMTGGPRNNWVHTTDVARAALFVARREEAAGQVYNIADDTPLSQGEILSAAIQAYGLDIGPTVPFPTGLLPSVTRFLNVDILFKVITNILTPLWKRIEQRHNLTGDLRINVDRSVLTYLGGDRIIGTDKLKALGFEPLYPDLREGMAETVKWYQERRWVPDYSAMAEGEVDYSDMGIALIYRERFEGALTQPDGVLLPAVLDLHITFPNVRLLLVDRTALLEGHITIDRLAHEAPVTGTLKVQIASGQMLYQFAFDDDQGQGYRFSGAKTFGLVTVVTDFTHLKGQVVDTQGEDLGQLQADIELKEGLVKTLLSIRLG